MTIYVKNSYLCHHGIKGQKWGVRRYQNKDGSLTNEGYIHYYGNSRKDSRYQRTIAKYAKKGKAYTNNLENYSVGELTTMVTKAGEEFTSGLINGHDFDWQEVSNVSGEIDSLATFIRDNPNSFGYSQKSNVPEVHAQGRICQLDMDSTNPDFGAPGTTQNCAKCSATLELKLRGYNDFISAGRQTYPSNVDANEFWFKGAERVNYDFDVAQEALTSYGPMTSGTLDIRYPSGGGHAMHWTNDIDGVFQIQDGQNGRVFNSIQEMASTYGADTTKSIGTFRLDNCEPDWDAMASDSVIRDNRSGHNAVRNRITGRVVDTW